MKELITIDEKTALEVFTRPDGLESAISQIEATARSIVPDASTDKGRKEIRSAAARIASGKVKLDNLGKAVAAEAKATVKLIDGNRRVVRDRLDALKTEIRAPLTEFEDAEKKRIHVIRNKLYEMDVLGMSSDEDGDLLNIYTLSANLKLLNSYTVTTMIFGEFEKEALKLKKSGIAALEYAIEREKERIAKDAELERLRKEAEDRKQQKYEDELKRNAAEDARLDAEHKAREESARIEWEKQEAIRQKEEAKRQAEGAEMARAAAVKKAEADAKAAEQRRLDDVKKAKQAEIFRQQQEAESKKAADEARAADLDHANKIRSEARSDLMRIFHIDALFAEDIVAAINEKKIANVMISY